MSSSDEPQADCREVLAQYLWGAGAGFFMSAFFVALSRAFIRFQPWLGIGLSSLFFLLSAWGFGWFLPHVRQRDSQGARRRRVNDAASMGFLLVAASCCLAAFLAASSILWFSSGLFLVSLATLYAFGRIAFGGVRSMWKRILEEADGLDDVAGVRGDGKEEPSEDDSGGDGYVYLAMIAGPAIASCIYLLVFLPLSLWVALSRGAPLVDVLLLVDAEGVSSGLGLLDRVRLLVSDPSFYVPLGVLYSATGITGLCIFSLRAKAISETASMAFGLGMGYGAAALVAHWSGIASHPTLLTPALGVTYVVLIHYLMDVVAQYLPKWGSSAKYDHLLDGLEGLATVYILSRVYGASAAIFGGAVFFVFSFVGASLWESTQGWFFKQAESYIDNRPLIQAWKELRSLLHEDRNRAKKASAKREILVVSLIAIAFPVLVYLLLAWIARTW